MGDDADKDVSTQHRDKSEKSMAKESSKSDKSSKKVGKSGQDHKSKSYERMREDRKRTLENRCKASTGDVSKPEKENSISLDSERKEKRDQERRKHKREKENNDKKKSQNNEDVSVKHRRKKRERSYDRDRDYDRYKRDNGYRGYDRDNGYRDYDREDRDYDRGGRDYDRNGRHFDKDYENRGYGKGGEDKNFERYWGEERDKVVFKTDSKEQDQYLVGTRYYTEPQNRKNERKRGIDDTGERKDNTGKEQKGAAPPPPKKNIDLLTSRTGGAYIPPGKLRLMQANITDKTSVAYQRIAWEALKKSIHGHINKVNISNIGVVARLLFKENIVRGRGLLCRSIIQAQAASPTFTNVYASLVSIINSKFPKIGELLLKRVIIQFKRAFKRNDKNVCVSAATFIAHLVNQRVAHEIIALEVLTLLVENPTDDSVEVAVAFLKESGEKLAEVSAKGSNAIFDMLRNILHEGKLDKRVQYMIEVMFQVRKDNFRSFPAVIEDLDLVNEEDQFTHLITLEDATDTQDLLNVFKLDGEYETNEDRYMELRKEILDDDDDDDEDGSEGSESDSDGSAGSDEEGGSDKEQEGKITIIDNTETNLIALRKTIYLTIQSSLDFEECAHKLLKMEIKPGQEAELCHMLLDCCAEQRTYEKFFGLLAQRFCQINRIYVGPFEMIFQDSYATVHRLDTNKLRNVAKFFAHLLFTDAISWEVLSTVKLNEEDTTSSSRIFIKILFQELSEYMGLANLNARVKDVTLQSAMEGLFPRDNPKNTRFAINFFTSIGLGGLTDELREHLKTQPKPSAVPQLISQLSSSSSSSSSSESSSSSDSSSSDSSTDSDSSSEEEMPKKKKKEELKTSRASGKENKKATAKEKKNSLSKERKLKSSTREDREDRKNKDKKSVKEKNYERDSSGKNH